MDIGSFKKIILQRLCNDTDRTQHATSLSPAYQFSINLIIALTLVLLTITLLVTVFYTCYQLYVPLVDLEAIYSNFLGFCKRHLAPKPAENFVFLTTVLFIPVLVYLLAKLTLFVTKRYSYNTFLQKYAQSMVCIFSLLIILFSYSSEYMVNLTLSTYQHTMNLVVLSGLTLFLWQRFNSHLLFNARLNKKWSLLIIVIVIFSIVLVSLSFRVSSLHLVGDTPSWVVNFGAAFYSVSQVVAGKSILVNLPAQYGMYSELLNPLFKLTGLSVFKFTLIMELLQMAALFAIFTTLWKTIHNKLLVLICMLTFCFITGFTWLFIQTGSPEPYYQYYPIRFFFPATSMLLLFLLIKDKSLRIISLLSIVSAMAIIWNTESGIAVFGTFLIYLGTFIFFPTEMLNRKKASTLLLYSISIFLICVLSFFWYLHLKSGQTLDFSLILKYQHTFYLSGLTMLPIPRAPDVWHIVIATYLLGIMGAVLNWINGKRPFRWDMMFCLSIMGIALFIYYQGRSHPNVLVIATWPAIVILFILCDLLFDLVRSHRIPRVFSIVCLPVLFFGLLMSTEFLISIPTLLNTMITRWNVMISATTETPITRNLSFIRQHMQDSKEAIILSPNQSVYYAEAHLASPINGPGAVEILLLADLEHLAQELVDKNHTLFFKPDAIGYSLDPYLKDTISQYHVLSTSQDEMKLLENKKYKNN